MTRPKKPASRPARSSSKRKSRKAPAGGKARTFKAFLAAAITAFGAASCALNPQWRDEFSLEPLLAQLGLSGEASPPTAVVSQGYAHTQFSECPQFFPRGRLPAVPATPTLRELCFSAFAILHNGQTRTPVFVAERLNRQWLERAKGVQRTDRFYAEARLPSAERADLEDYRGSGYSRGHMAPAGNMGSVDAMAQSFSLANMVPQDQRQNAGPWSRIEEDTRRYVMRAAGDVYVFTGPVYQGGVREVIGKSRVAVPTHLYKVVYDPNAGRAWVHWQANDPKAQVGAPIAYEEFVRRTGLHLLPPNVS